MGDELESQVEEDEVLLAIYDGDPAFKRISSTVFQYRCGDDGSPKSILLEISWPPTYPTEKPNINLDTFYNQHLDQNVKNFFKEKVDEKAEQYLGVAMTYTLIELVKDNLESWFIEVSKHQPSKPVPQVEEQLSEEIAAVNVSEPSSKKEPKKEQLSKAQKRRQWDRCDARRERPRGWNWVDIVKHLSQSGSQAEITFSTNS
ncbi:hypothetical protein V9T40_012963 [Parthenolecanium corni]|uniref:RWD domain-containing protein n=1 Tax=Parthenolecanium corni TaxID=536013 RepID=A0AAN9XZU5_9HEMI